MLEFPRLKTGVKGQHPITCEILADTRVFRFLDGQTQRFPARKLRRRWTVHLDLLDEEEAWQVEEFARKHFMTAEPFRFVDPRTGREYAPCHLAGSRFEVTADGPMKRRCSLVVMEGGS